MGIHLKHLALLVSIVASSLVMAADKNCVDCGMKDVQGMPENKSLAQLERIVKSANKEDDFRQATQDDYFDKYCMKFTQTPKTLVGTLIAEFEKTPYGADEYFYHTKCQPKGYSTAVKSPMIHYIAEAPESRGEFLNMIWLYYSKKRKEPEIFTKILNTKNSKGETILDYIESLRSMGTNVHVDLQAPVAKLISFICSHGGVYATYKTKSCSN